MKIEYKTEAVYKKARMMLNAYQKKAIEYMKENKTSSIPLEVYTKFPFSKLVNNDLRSAIEVYEFKNDPPDKYFLYINEQDKTATTFTGQEIGKVIFLNEYISNMNDKRIAIRINAINGLKYYGTFFKSSGDYARIKRVKAQPHTYTATTAF